jgi:myo-inositol-1(or 4)-monophosphatase
VTAACADRRLLEEALKEAAVLARRHFAGDRDHWHKGPGQVLTETDLAVDRLLKDRLLGARPEYGWLSEESPDDGSRFRTTRAWVVDPIDGTRAFAEGTPEFTISVGLIEGATPVLGIIVNPVTGEWFGAEDRGDAWTEAGPCRVSGQDRLEGARLLSSRGEIRQRGWRDLLPEAEVRTMGSLAYKLALIAAGRFDGLVSLRRTHDWDLAAALLVLERAGGVITDAAGSPLRLNRDPPRHDGLIAAAGPALHEALRQRLAMR